LLFGNRRRLPNSGPSSLAYSAAGRNGAVPTRINTAGTLHTRDSDSSRDTLAIGERAWACGWVDGAGPSARLRLDLKLIGLGRRAPQPAAVTAAWPGPCSLAGPTAALAGHGSACGATACRGRRPAWRVRPGPPWCRARLSHAWLSGRARSIEASCAETRPFSFCESGNVRCHSSRMGPGFLRTRRMSLRTRSCLARGFGRAV